MNHLGTNSQSIRAIHQWKPEGVRIIVERNGKTIQPIIKGTHEVQIVYRSSIINTDQKSQTSISYHCENRTQII